MFAYRNLKASKINVTFDRKNVIRIGILIMAISMAVLFSANSMRTYALGDIGSYSLISESAATNGQGGNNNATAHIGGVSMSQDGSMVAFESAATDLVANDVNGKKDIFYRKTDGGGISRASISTTGAESDQDSLFGAVSATGRYIVYMTKATTLEAGTNPQGRWHMYMHDTKTNDNHLLPYVNTTNIKPWAVSDDGRFVTVESTIPDLRDAIGQFVTGTRLRVYDRSLDTWTRLDSPVSGGEQRNYYSRNANANCDGSFVVFESQLSNITDETDQNGQGMDIILVDLRNGVKVKNITHEFNGDSYYPDVSCNGRYVTFLSTSTDIATTSTGAIPPSTGNQNRQMYRYDRINGDYDLVSQSTNGNLMALGGGSSPQFTTSDDNGLVYFQSRMNQLVQPQDFERTYVRNIKTETTSSVKDANLQYFFVTQVKRAVDSKGEKMIFVSGRSDIVPTANNGKGQIFLGKLD